MQTQLQYKPGDKIGSQYHVHKAVMGGMSEVYICIHNSGIPVVLKTLQKRFMSNYDNYQEIFTKEATTWVLLGKHPNIVHCKSTLKLDAISFINLEFIGDENGNSIDLRKMFRKGPINLSSALGYIIDICRGMLYAQHKVPGLVHRDLKPENILITSLGIAKITDFGLVQIIEKTLAPDLGKRSHPVGTLPYMAPEIWQGEEDERTDLYAIGCMLFEALVGHPPFQAKTPDDFRLKHINEPVPNLPNEMELSEIIDPVIKKCLEKVKENRYPTIELFLKEVEEIHTLHLGFKKPVIDTLPDEISSSDYLYIGVAHTNTRQYKKAIDYLNKAIELAPTMAQAYSSRGCAYYGMKQYSNALSDFDQALELDANLAHAYNHRGQIHLNLENYEQALQDLNRAIELDPDNAWAYGNRSAIYSGKEEYEKALNDLNTALKLEPSNGLLHRDLGVLFAKLEHYDKARELLNKAILLNPHDTLAYYNRGYLYYHHFKKTKDALQDLNDANRIEPTYHAYFQIGMILGNQGRFLECLQAMEMAKQFSEYNQRPEELDQLIADIRNALDEIETKDEATRLTTILQLGIARFKEKYYEDAIECLSAVILNRSETASAYFYRGQAYIEQGNLPSGLMDLDMAIRFEPNNVNYYAVRGSIHADQKRYDLASRDYSMIINLEPDSREAYTNRGLTYVYTDEYQKALNDFEKAIQIDPERLQSYRDRALTYSLLNQHTEALEDYYHVLQSEADDKVTWYNAGISHLKRGKDKDIEDALSCLNAAARLEHVQASILLMQLQQKFDSAIQKELDSLEPFLQAIAAAAQGNYQAEHDVLYRYAPFLSQILPMQAIKQIIRGEQSIEKITSNMDLRGIRIIQRIFTIIQTPSVVKNLRDSMPRLNVYFEDFTTPNDLDLDMQQLLKDFEPLLQAIAAVALGDQSPLNDIRSLLSSLSMQGWNLVTPVSKLLHGNRNIDELTFDLHPNTAKLVLRVLEIISEKS